jgi:hypothetical protein
MVPNMGLLGCEPHRSTEDDCSFLDASIALGHEWPTGMSKYMALLSVNTCEVCTRCGNSYRLGGSGARTASHFAASISVGHDPSMRYTAIISV